MGCGEDPVAMKCESESNFGNVGVGVSQWNPGKGKKRGGQTKHNFFSFLPLRPSSGLGRKTRIRKLHARGANNPTWTVRTVLTIGSYEVLAP